MMNEIIKRAVEKYNLKNKKGKVIVWHGGLSEFELYKTDSINKLSLGLFELLLNPKYDFLQTLVGDEMVCPYCLRDNTSIHKEDGEEYKYCTKCSGFLFIGDLLNTDGLVLKEDFKLKHQVLAERLFRLLYRGEEEEAIKLLGEWV